MAVLIKEVFQETGKGVADKQDSKEEESEQRHDLGQSPTESDLSLILQGTLEFVTPPSCSS